MATNYLRGDVATVADVSGETVTRWSERGLLRPSRDSSGRRIYSAQDLEIAKALARQRSNGRLTDRLAEITAREAGRQ